MQLNRMKLCDYFDHFRRINPAENRRISRGVGEGGGKRCFHKRNRVVKVIVPCFSEHA